MSLSEPILVFDIGGTKVAAAILEPDFAVRQRSEIATNAAEGPERVAERIAALGRTVLDGYAREHPDRQPPRRAGVASAGQIDRATGTVSYATFHLPGWIGFPLGSRLSAGLGMPVAVDNDVNCHALAEAVLGAGRPYR
ncbi:MAG: ROK family protein, partial [Caldilineaceae bacterium]|nr:ROK family protein [Caldilineaceae bacterium]